MLLAAMLCNVMVLSSVPCEVSIHMFDTAFEYYQHAEQYFNTNDFTATITGHTVPSIGKPQVIYGIRQRSGEDFFFQTVVLGASTLGKNPSGALQRLRTDNNVICYRHFKPKAPKRRGDVVSIDFEKAEWIKCTPEEYKAKWKTNPESLTPFNITADTPSKISREKNGNVTATFYVDFEAAKDHVDNIKASSNIGVKSGTFTITIVFDKNARAIKITEHSTYKMNILTSPTVTASITETIKYQSAAALSHSQKSNAGEFVYKY